MTTKLQFGRDVQGYNAFAPSPSTDEYSATVASAGNSTIQVPSNYQSWIVSFSFSPGSDVWVAYGDSTIAAAPPGGATFASTNSELLPGARTLAAGTYINCYNNGTGDSDIGIVMYGIY
jgi:hypothetical protein